MTQTIQIQERLKTQSFNNLPEEIQRFLITAQGKYIWLNPICPHCCSDSVVHNGYYECESELIKSLGLRIRHGHYLCKACAKTFSTKYPGLIEFENIFKLYLKENCFELFVQGLSLDKISIWINQRFPTKVNKETVREYYTELCNEFKSQNILKSSGFFNVDCQHTKVNGVKSYRLTIIDAISKKCLADVVIPFETNERIIERLRLHLLPYKIKGFIVDGKLGLADDIKKEFSVPVQRCIFHVQQLIVKDYLKKYGKNMSLLQQRNMYLLLSIFTNHDIEVQFLNQRIKEKTCDQDERRGKNQFYDFRKDLKKFRRKQKQYLIPRTEEEMKQKLKEAEKFITEPFEKKRIQKIKDEWKMITQFLHTEGLSPTNNNVEHYYSKTLTKTEKKRFRGLEALKNKITATKAIFNGWFKPTVTLQEILQKYAILSYRFAI